MTRDEHDRLEELVRAAKPRSTEDREFVTLVKAAIYEIDQVLNCLKKTKARAEQAEAERDAAEVEIGELRDEVSSIAQTTREANEFVVESMKRYPTRAAAGLTEGGQS
jgi:uncharacterized coiled-coil DUF342 family protein